MIRGTKSGSASDRFRRMAEEQARAAASAVRSFLTMADNAEAVEIDRKNRAAEVVPRNFVRRLRRFG